MKTPDQTPEVSVFTWPQKRLIMDDADAARVDLSRERADWMAVLTTAQSEIERLRAALRQVVAMLDQPVHKSNTRSANAILFLRADSETCRLIASAALRREAR